MSLSWRERVELGFYPDRVVLTRAKGTEALAVQPGPPDAPRWENHIRDSRISPSGRRMFSAAPARSGGCGRLVSSTSK